MPGTLKAAVALLTVLGISDIAFFPATLSGDDNPPVAVGILTLVVGIVTLAATVGLIRRHPRARSVTYATRAIDAVSALPAFFVDVNAGLVAAATATIALSVLAIVLVARREPSMSAIRSA